MSSAAARGARRQESPVIKAALAALSAPQPNTDPEPRVEGRDPRDHGARTWDALVETCQKALDTDALPESHGAKPRVMVLIDHDALVSGLGTATLDTGHRISATAAASSPATPRSSPACSAPTDTSSTSAAPPRLVTLGICWLADRPPDRRPRSPADPAGRPSPATPTTSSPAAQTARPRRTPQQRRAWCCSAARHHTDHPRHALGSADPPHRHGRPEFKPPPGRHRLHPAPPRTPRHRRRLDPRTHPTRIAGSRQACLWAHKNHPDGLLTFRAPTRCRCESGEVP